MRRGFGGRRTSLVAATLLLAWLLTPIADAKDLAPFGVVLDVRWGDDAGSDAFRDDLALSLAGALASRCFENVSMAGDAAPLPQAEIALAVELSGLVDETRFDDPIATALQPGEPDKELRRVARFEVRVDVTLFTRASDVVVQTKHFVANVYRRPIFPGEDPQAVARSEAIDRIVSDVARWLRCGQAKLERKVRDALGTDESPVSPPR